MFDGYVQKYGSTSTIHQTIRNAALVLWKGNEELLPIVFAMDQDLLSFQAFMRRTRVTPPAVEMLVCLNDYLDIAERVQDKSSLDGEMDYNSKLLQEEVEAGLSKGITGEEETAYYESNQISLEELNMKNKIPKMA
ncbi:hypothetical protein R6Q59_031221 [Mikania micrantha]